MVALVLLLDWTSPLWASEPAVHLQIGAKGYTESVILAEMFAHLTRHAGGEATVQELAGTEILWKALLKGEIDVYPEYMGTLTQQLLKGVPAHDDRAIQDALAQRGLRISKQLGFSNSYALGLRDELAEKHQIRKISDLAAHSQLRLGVSEEFYNRHDGWPGLSERYGLKPANLRTMDHNLALRGLKSGAIDITDVYSTDPEIRLYQLRLLEDTKGYFPLYHAVILYRADLEQRAPRVVEQLRRLEGLISDTEMVDLNARVRMEQVSETRTAADFLNRKLSLGVVVPEDSSWKEPLARLWRCTYQHLFLVAVSLTAAVLVAVPLGIWAARRPVAGQVILGVTGIIQTLPSLALLVFMIPLLGLGAWSAIVALFLYSLLPIVRNTATGLQEIAPSLKESAEILGLPSWVRLWRIELPLASRSILGGIKTAAVINVGTATIGALIGAGGYGQPILTGIRLDDVSMILQGAIPAAVLAVLVQGLFSLAERLVVPKGLRLK